MSNDSEVTPIDRPLMRSDLDAIRQAMYRFEQRQVTMHSALSAKATEPRLMAIVCFCCALISIGCAVVGLK